MMFYCVDMEDSGIPQYLRDAQVGTIWEGSSNMLALDVLRALRKSPKTLRFFVEAIKQRITVKPELKVFIDEISIALEKIKKYTNRFNSMSKELIEEGKMKPRDQQ